MAKRKTNQVTEIRGKRWISRADVNLSESDKKYTEYLQNDQSADIINPFG